MDRLHHITVLLIGNHMRRIFRSHVNAHDYFYIYFVIFIFFFLIINEIHIWVSRKVSTILLYNYLAKVGSIHSFGSKIKGHALRKQSQLWIYYYISYSSATTLFSGTILSLDIIYNFLEIQGWQIEISWFK